MRGFIVYNDSRSSATYSLEELVDGKTHNEIERVFYGKVSESLINEIKAKAIDKEHHEQWNIKTPNGSVRVRAYKGEDRYVLTTKTKGKETDCETSKDQFEHFKVISGYGMIKDRYNFPIDTSDMTPLQAAKWKELKWEIDLFILPDGKYAPWCKIDLELGDHPEEMTPLPKLPFHFDKVLTDKAEDKEDVTSIYEQYFITKA